MQQRPLISIVIPTYNRARDLHRALKSVKAQTFNNWEALIVDNHSTDNTEEVVVGFNDQRVKFFRINNDGVIAVSRNFGVHKAAGEYIAFLDSDDWWKPKKLEESLKYLEKGEDIVFHELFLATKQGQSIFWRRAQSRDLKSPIFDDLVKNGNALPNSSVVVRLSVINRVNGFSEDRNLIAIEDYDCWLRIAQITEKFKRIPKPLGFYWFGGNNISGPERTLKTMSALEGYYANTTSKTEYDTRNYLHSYIKGRAEYKLKLYNEAKKNLELISWGKVPFWIYLKARWMLWVSNIYC